MVGINLLREGLDLPEVGLVAILDADKEGFLRNRTSLIQTIGRAARNAEGRVILYADRMTDSMQAALLETERRRQIQIDYNERHGIIPTTVTKKIDDIEEVVRGMLPDSTTTQVEQVFSDKLDDPSEIKRLIEDTKGKMPAAAEAANSKTRPVYAMR